MSYARPFDLEASQPLDRIETLRPAADKLLGLELMRFASALAVLIFHYNHFADMAGMPPIGRAVAPFHAWLWPLYDYGKYGVQVFWGISGYIFFWKYGAAIHAGSTRSSDFFWLRFSRLYPLHLVTLFSVVGLQLVHRNAAGSDFEFPAQGAGLFLRHLFLASDWGTPGFSFNGPIWSVSAEVAVYAGFFLLLRHFAPSKRLCIYVVMAGLAVMLAGVTWASISCAVYFFAGGLATFARGKTPSPAAIIAVVTTIGLAVTGAFGEDGKLPMIFLATIPCLLTILARPWTVLERWQGPIQVAGNLTYSSYLLNFPLQLVVAIAVASSDWRPPFASPHFLISYVAITLAVATISYHRFELPAQNWLRRRTLRRAV